MIVRNLLSRFGIEPDSPQLRCIATSASLSDDNSGLDFLEQFFGVDRSSFFVTAGQPRQLDAKLPISRQRILDLWNSEPVDTRARAEQVADKLTSRWVRPRAADLARPTAPHPEMRPGVYEQPESQTLPKLFDEPDTDGTAIQVALQALGELPSGSTAVPLRAHMFCEPRGLWACSNPACDQMSTSGSRVGIGRLFTIPTTTCSCGGECSSFLLLRVRRHQSWWIRHPGRIPDDLPRVDPTRRSNRTGRASISAFALRIPLVPTRGLSPRPGAQLPLEAKAQDWLPFCRVTGRAILDADGQATGMVVSGFPGVEDLAPASLPASAQDASSRQAE